MNPTRPSSSQSAVGADIESICSKCGDVWHVVVAKVGTKIVKVQCKQCGGQHRYRPPAGEAPAPPSEPRPRARKAAAAAAPPPAAMPEPDLSRPPRSYRPTEAYQKGDRIVHPRFGTGVAADSPGPGKIEVVFRDGPRILAMAKAAPALTRPAARPAEGDEG